MKERQNDYGDFYYNFMTIGKIWGALLGVGEIKPYQVGLMMDSLKTVRAFNNPESEDSWADKIGYTNHAHSSAFYDIKKKK